MVLNIFFLLNFQNFQLKNFKKIKNKLHHLWSVWIEGEGGGVE